MKCNNTLIYDSDTGMAVDYGFPSGTFAFTLEGLYTHWTHICKKCAKIFKVNRDNLEEIEKVGAMGSKTRCGVEGCDNTSFYFYDFNGTDNFFIAAVRRAKI